MFTLLAEMIPSKPTWTADKMPDCSGKVFLVTGGNAGIGYETVKALLAKGGKVYMASRSRGKAEEAITELERETGKRAIFLELDLASLASIKRSAAEFTSKESQLNVLFNNGGVMAVPMDLRTADGYDLQFGTNVLGHFYLTKLLLPTILATADANPGDKPRIINTSSFGHRLGSATIDYGTVQGDSAARDKLGKWGLYQQSKFGNVVFANELARRYGDKIVSASLHPGAIKTKLYDPSTTPGSISEKLGNLLLADPWMGALTQLYAGTDPEVAKTNGKYYIPYARIGKATAKSDDPETGKKLWSWLEEQVKDL